jgi:hypothetical protein
VEHSSRDPPDVRADGRWERSDVRFGHVSRFDRRVVDSFLCGSPKTRLVRYLPGLEERGKDCVYGG